MSDEFRDVDYRSFWCPFISTCDKGKAEMRIQRESNHKAWMELALENFFEDNPDIPEDMFGVRMVESSGRLPRLTCEIYRKDTSATVKKIVA